MMTRLRTRDGAGTTLLISSVLALACGGDVASESMASVTVDTLPNGTIHVRNDGTGWSAEDAWRPVEVTRIGAVDADDPYLFSAAWSLSLALDFRGRLYVADLQLAEVRLFDADGAFLRTVATRGEGPGEVSQPVAIAVGPDDELWVVDPRNRRYSVFDSAGSFVTSHARDVGSFGLYKQAGFGEGGSRWYEEITVSTGGPRESRHALLRQPIGDEGLADPDTFVIAPDFDVGSGTFFIDYGDGSAAARPIPYAPELRFAFAGDGSVWSGTGETYRLVQRAFGGDTLRVVEMPDADAPVDRALVDTSMAWLDDLPGNVRDQVDPARIPAVAPEFDGIRVDDRGDVWVSLGWRPVGQPSDSARFDVFAPDGRYRGRVTLPFDPRPWPVVRGDRIAGVVTDELDVPQIVVYRLEGR